MGSPRIGVVKDAELAAALDASRDLLDESARQSEAGQVRQLAIIGAHAVLARDGESVRAQLRRRFLGVPGYRSATERLEDLPWLDGPIDESGAGSAALDWARGDM